MDLHGRTDPPQSAGERETVEAFLEFQRESVALKARGLSDADATRHLVPSLTTVSGLIRHLADVERSWYREDLDGEPDVPTRYTEDDPDGEFRVSASDSLEGLLADYAAACAESRAVAARYALDDLCREHGRHSLRWVHLHMIEETARHLGHIDILREQTDGATGE